MKWLGLTLLLFGFGWISFNSILLAPKARAVTVKYFEQVNTLKSTELNAEKVRSLVSSSVYEYYTKLPNNFLPAILMLCGGLILFRENGRSVGVRNSKE